jgi:hypothetical protein
MTSPTPNLEKRWLSPSELEAEFGFSKSAQAKMRMASSSSTLPFSKVGGYIRYDRTKINMWLESHSI